MTDSRRSGSRSLDLLMVALLAVLVVGGHILVWADDPGRGLVSGNQLFSIWALPAYVGFLPAAYVLFLWWSSRRKAGRAAVPAGYRAALVGAALFLVGIAADFAWRSVAGRPSLGEGVLAPSRIILFVGAALLISGPLSSIAARISSPRPPRRVASVDAVAYAVAVGLLMALASLMTGFAHPFVVLAGAAVEQPGPPPTDLYLVPIDGGGSQRLTVTSDQWETHPAVAPDGSRIAFTRGDLDDGRIFTAAPDGSGATRLTDRATDEDGPAWSPDGTRLTVWAPPPAQPVPTPTAPAPAPGPWQAPPVMDMSGLGIWIISAADGTGAPLRQGSGEGAETWSPDGTRLCGWTLDAGRFNVAVWDVASGAYSQLTDGPGDSWGCDWSPDGARVVFHSDRSGNWEIYSAAPDGSDLRQLTNDPGIDQLPRWSPDGSQFAFMSSRGGELDIWLGSADGSSARNLTNDPALEDGFYGLDWLPDGSGLIAASGGRGYAAPASRETVPLGVGALALNALLVTGVLLFALRFAGPMAGMGTIAGLVGGALAAFVGSEPLFFLSTVGAGVAADLVMWRSRSTDQRPTATLAGAAAGALTATYFVVLAATRGIGWGLDLVLGTVVLATVLAVGLGLLVGWTQRSDQSNGSGARVS